MFIAATIGGGIAYVSVKKSTIPTVTPLPRLPGSVACVTSLYDVYWSKGVGGASSDFQPHLFASLFPGQQLAVDRGLIEISFDSGARVILDGPIAC